MWTIDRIVNQLGEGNAQLFRELKGRATGRNLWLAIGASGLSQVVLLLIFMLQFPTDPSPGMDRHSQAYCVLETIKKANAYSAGFYEQKVCQLNALGQVSIDWPHWWTAVLISLAWLLPLVLITGSVYLLANDLRREEKRGTLNFLRLSPQSAPEIFLGKLLGVPILVLVAVAAAMPLFFLATFSSGLGVANILAWLVLTVAIAGVFSLAAMLMTLASPSLPIVISALSLWLASSLFTLMNWLLQYPMENKALSNGSNDLWWFFLPITQSNVYFYLFGIGNCLVASYWLWQALCRRYLNPQGTLLAKKSSYQLNFCLQLWLVGFGWPLFTGHSGDTGRGSTLTIFMLVVALGQIAAAFAAIFLLTPQRQAIQEWSRYRRASNRKNFWQKDIWADLLWHDRSPAVFCFAVNLAIALVIWLPWCLFTFESQAIAGKAIISAILTAFVLLNYGIFVQMWLIGKRKWPWQQASSFLTLAIALPLLGAGLLATIGLKSLGVVVAVALSPFSLFGIWEVSFGSLLMGVAVQSLLTMLVVNRLQHQVQKIGQSEMQAALSAA